MDEHELATRAYVRRRVPDADVDDIVQRVFIALWLKPDGERDAIASAPARVQRTWLFRAAGREIRTYRRTCQRAERRLERLRSTMRAVLADTDVLHLVDTPVDRAVERLPKRQRQVLRAIYYDGRSAAEVAAALGTSEAAIRQRLARALGHFEQLYISELKRRPQ